MSIGQVVTDAIWQVVTDEEEPNINSFKICLKVHKTLHLISRLISASPSVLITTDIELDQWTMNIETSKALHKTQSLVTCSS